MAASATTAATGTAVITELQHKVEATVDAGAAVAAMVPIPMPVTPVAVEALSVVMMPDTLGRPAAEVPAVSDLLVLLLHLRDARTSWSGSARLGRAAEGGHGKSQSANGE